MSENPRSVSFRRIDDDNDDDDVAAAAAGC
jgi:hypothetical protein